jgi:DNA-binding SARP family transcriptional activator
VLKFLVLGDVEVRIDGIGAPLDSAMSRGLLAMLLLNANQFVSSERLIEALWERPPASAGSNLRTYAAHLRRVFEVAGARHPLETRRGGGYRVDVHPGELD